MKRYKKRDYIYQLILALFVLFVVVLITRFRYLYGSTLDWESQHYRIPEYFRKQFYQTGQLLPEFAANLGAGQNSFYFSYYGLLNPFILLSYALPFVSMRSYVMTVSVVLVIASAWLFYRWIFKKFGTKVAFFSSFLFVCSAPLIFHSHRHIMFVSYMVFVILGFIGVDRYFEEKKKGLLLLSATLMIFTNYFFAVGGMVALAVYAIGTYLELETELTWKRFLRAAAEYAATMFCCIGLSAVLLLPTLYTLLHGRSDSNVTIDYQELLIPNFHGNFILYRTYSLGLTAIGVIALVYGVCSKYKRLKFISICMSCMCFFGIFVYLLNGTMYMEGKALIPFLPLSGYVTASMLSKLARHEYDFKRLLKIVLLANIPILLTFRMSDSYLHLYLLDLSVTMLGIGYFNTSGRFKYFVFNTMLIAAAVCIHVNLQDSLVEKDSGYLQSEETMQTMMEELEQTYAYTGRVGNLIGRVSTMNSVYRMNQYTTTLYSSVYNMDYNRFFYDEVRNENPYRNSAIMSQPMNLLFNLYMGNRYMIGKNVDIAGYLPVMTKDDITLYENKDAQPIGRCLTDSLSMEAYENLDYPYRTLALCTMAVTEESENIKTKLPEVKEVTVGDLSAYCEDGFLKEQGEGSYLVNLQQPKGMTERINRELRVPLPEEYQTGEYLFLVSLSVDNSAYKRKNEGFDYPNKDVIITINGIKNKLSDPNWKYYNHNENFEYTISSNKKLDTLQILFYDGRYVIRDFKIYAVKYEALKSAMTGDSLEIDWEKSVGNRIEGEIDCRADGEFVLTIPYDEGFHIYCDGKEMNVKKMDTAFLGCSLAKGQHHILVEYHAPWLKTGKMVSGLTLVLCMVGYGWQKKKKR